MAIAFVQYFKYLSQVKTPNFQKHKYGLKVKFNLFSEKNSLVIQSKYDGKIL